MSGARKVRLWWLIPAALLLAAGIVAIIVFGPGDKTHTPWLWVLDEQIDGEMFSSAGTALANAYTVQAGAPMQVGCVLGSAMRVEVQTWDRSMKEGTTTGVIQMTLAINEYRRDWLEEIKNLPRRVLGRPLVETKHLITETTLLRSDRVFLRQLPKGKCYLSFADDRKHMLPGSLVGNDNPGFYTLRGILLAHWQSWMAQAQTIASENEK